ncbi:hypothetical protein [Ancylobacter sp. IITR112]|uniref:hypothetical protein n=1 Tax=Ancylobacter sp. IITR112 TaxID=3138073 RepID=UPI00352A821B
MSDRRPHALTGLRALGNLAAIVALLLLADAAWAWWTGSTTMSCSAARAVASDSAQLLLGMGGLLLAMVGVMLGGARHPLTGLGIIIMVVGLILSGMLPALLDGICGMP